MTRATTQREHSSNRQPKDRAAVVHSLRIGSLSVASVPSARSATEFQHTAMHKSYAFRQRQLQTAAVDAAHQGTSIQLLKDVGQLELVDASARVSHLNWDSRPVVAQA